MARTYSASRIVFNRSIADDVNMRVFEALASGSLLMTNDLARNGQAEFFHDGLHLATYREPEELLDKVAFYLGHEEARERIAAAGRAEVVANHTYRHRMEEMLRIIHSKTRHIRSVPVTAQPPEPASVAEPPPALTAPPQSENVTARLGSDLSYFEFARPEVAALVPSTARRILDIGCGAGRLGEALKARQEAVIWGIEPVPEAAEAAKTRLDHVVQADVEHLDPFFAQEFFDTVICADVLEHLRDPAAVLAKIHGWLAPGGQLVASIPNVRHHTVVRGLLEGNWTYEPAGLLDRTHLRFYTRREIEKLLYRACFTITEIQAVPGPGYDAWEAAGCPSEVKIGRLHLGGLERADAEEFYVYQYLVRATKAKAPDRGLTSIIIVTHNQIGFTRQCVESVRQYTDDVYELIFVDNGSTDGTVEYLRSLAGAQVLTNPDNRGFPAAVNQGLQVAKGKQILLLNNDTVVTTGWLRTLLEALYSDSSVGLVGPCSNFVSGEQQVPVSYDELTGVDGFAWEWSKAHNQERVDTDRLVGFCLLIRREVVEAVGTLDERFGIGCFEDDDYCFRARQAGFRAMIARDAFVHHFGGRTFVASGVDFSALMSRNEALFREKWQTRPEESKKEPRAAPDSEPPPTNGFTLARAEGGGLLLVPSSTMKLSMCMIARNNERTIGPALASARPWVDEMIVLDTGSTDRTVEIAKAHGARVYHFPWCDDFSAARNESLKYARGMWIFWMDSDDTLDETNGRMLHALANADGPANVLGYVMQVHCPGAGEAGGLDVTEVDHVKMFRNRPDLRFDGRIHEQILPAIRQAGGDVVFTDIFVTHTGYDHSPEGQRKKLERDLRILHLELKERPDHPFTLFNLGMTYADVKDWDRAIGFLRRSITCSPPDASHLRKAYALLVYCLAQQNDHRAAVVVCQTALQKFPRDVELRFRQAVLLHDAGRLRDAAAVYEDILCGQSERHFSSRDRALNGFKARHNLAAVYTDMGELAKAEGQWRKVVEEVPTYRPGWRGLGQMLLQQGRIGEARQLAETLSAAPRLRCEGLFLAANTALAGNDPIAARARLQQAISDYPDDPEAWQAWTRFAFEHGNTTEALEALNRLVSRDPTDASAHHNVGTVYLRMGKPAEAVRAYEESLRHRPKSPATYINLGYALRDSGKGPAAVRAWRQALDLAPGNPEAQQAMRAALGEA